MSLFVCARMNSLLERRSVLPSAAEQLLLESHLAACPGCCENARLYRAAQELVVQAGESPLRRGAVDRMVIDRGLQRAFAASQDRSDVRPQARPLAERWRLVVWAVCALVLTVSVGTFALRHSSHANAPQSELVRDALSRVSGDVVPGDPTSTEPLGRANEDVVRGGEVTIEGRLVPLGAGIPADMPITVRQEAALSLARATVQISGPSSLRWQASASRLYVEGGKAHLSVVHAGHAFYVSTQRFVVEDLGTEFIVEGNDVHVLEGSVRVRSPSGAILVDELKAPGSWSWSEAPLAVTEEAAVHSAVSPKVLRHPASEHRASRCLIEGRHALAMGNIEAAQQQVACARAASPTRREQAEASSLLADCDRAAGRPGSAVLRYLELQRVYADLPAGEVALFAAARLEMDQGHAAAAVKLLHAYVARYPHGRFSGECLAHLHRLESP